MMALEQLSFRGSANGIYETCVGSLSRDVGSFQWEHGLQNVPFGKRDVCDFRAGMAGMPIEMHIPNQGSESTTKVRLLGIIEVWYPENGNGNVTRLENVTLMDGKRRLAVSFMGSDKVSRGVAFLGFDALGNWDGFAATDMWGGNSCGECRDKNPNRSFDIFQAALHAVEQAMVQCKPESIDKEC